MRGKMMIVRFLCLGPARSEFAIPCLQITDSWCVAHPEPLLYRPGYDEFLRGRGEGGFFRFLHSARADSRSSTAPAKSPPGCHEAAFCWPGML